MKTVVDTLLQPYWDTITYSTSAITAGTDTKLFATPYDGSSKVYGETNQTKNGTCKFNFCKILKISAYVYARSVSALITHDDAHKILANQTLTIYKKNKPMLDIPLLRLGSGVGITGNVTNTNNSTLGIPSNGMCLLDNAYDVGYNPNTGEEGIDFTLDETFDIHCVAQKAFTPAVGGYLAIVFWCDVDNVIN